MTSRLRAFATACTCLLGAALSPAASPADTTSEQADYSRKRVPVSAEQVWILRGGNGAEIYAEFCAECHGAAGTGNPIAAAALDEPIPSLVGLADARKPGNFARGHVLHVLDSRCDTGFHKTSSGAQTMPCWRRIVSHAFECDSDAAAVTARLVKHLESLQK